jgi:hypothetical protein
MTTPRPACGVPRNSRDIRHRHISTPADRRCRASRAPILRQPGCHPVVSGIDGFESCFTGRVGGCKIDLLSATTIGTLAERACEIAARLRHHAVSAATTSTAMSVACAPRARTQTPVSRVSRKAFRALRSRLRRKHAGYAPVRLGDFCPRIASNNLVFPWSMTHHGHDWRPW